MWIVDYYRYYRDILIIRSIGKKARAAVSVIEIDYGRREATAWEKLVRYCGRIHRRWMEKRW